MNLHRGRLFWPEITKVKKLNTVDEINDKKNEILIVGGGISGAISAYRLSKMGHRVTLIEKDKIGMGSTAASTGLIQYMSDRGVRYYIENLGFKEGKKFYDMSVEAIDKLIELDGEIEELEVDTFQTKESLILATDKEKLGDIIAEVVQQQDLGYGAKFYSEDELEDLDIEAYGALGAFPDVALNPFGFVYRLLMTAIDKYDLDVIEGLEFIEISNYDEKDSKDQLEVAVESNRIKKNYKFDKVLFATGYNPPKFLLEKTKLLSVNKTYVTVSDDGIEMDEKPDFLVWEVKDPYTYFRKTFDGRFMIGGLDEKDSIIQPEDADKNSQDLVELTKNMLANKDVIIESEYSYAALFGESDDNIPYMGTDTEHDNIMLICGAGGNGTVYSTIASEIALAWADNKDLSQYKLFSLNR